MIPADTVTHAITLTAQRPPYPGMNHTYGATCKCGWRMRELDQEARDEQVKRHRTYTGAEVVR